MPSFIFIYFSIHSNASTLLCKYANYFALTHMKFNFIKSNKFSNVFYNYNQFIKLSTLLRNRINICVIFNWIAHSLFKCLDFFSFIYLFLQNKLKLFKLIQSTIHFSLKLVILSRIFRNILISNINIITIVYDLTKTYSVKSFCNLCIDSMNLL